MAKQFILKLKLNASKLLLFTLYERNRIMAKQFILKLTLNAFKLLLFTL